MDSEYSYRDSKKIVSIDLPQNSLSGVLLNQAQTVLDHLSQHTVAVLMPSLAGVLIFALLACTARFLLQGQISDGCIRDISVRQHDQQETHSSAFDGINANSSSLNGVIQSHDWAPLASGIKKTYIHQGGNEILFHGILNLLIEETADALSKGMNQQQIEDNCNQMNQPNNQFKSSSQLHIPFIHFSPQSQNTTFDGEYSSPAVTSWPLSMGQCSPRPIDEELLPVVFELVYEANSLIGMESEERRRDQRYNMKFLRLEIMEKKELTPIWSLRVQESDLWVGHFSKMSKNSIKPEPSEPGLFVNFETPKFITKTPVASAVEQSEMGDEIEKFLQAELQPTLQDIERQLTPRQAVSERTQMVMAKVLEAMTGVQVNEIDFWAMNILNEQNGEARRREIQYPSLQPVTSVPVPDEVLDAKRSPIDKILQRKQALALYNFRIGEGILAHLCEQQEDNLPIDILSQMIHKLRETERTHFPRAQNENGTNANYFNLAANSINSNLNSEAGSHMLGAHFIARSDTANKDAIGITNLLFGIQQLGKARVKNKRFRQLTPSAIWKQAMRPMLNQNGNQALTQNQEIQIRKIQDEIPPTGSGPRDLPPPGHGLYAQRNAAIPQSIILPPILNTEQEILAIPNILTKETIKDHTHKWMLKGFNLILVRKDDEGNHWPGFGPGVPHATDWRKAKQQGQTLSMDDVRAFWKEHDFDLRVA
ncbi:MAG: hypothetical protein EZS28_005291 [Streblomastix strix]|uniref:Uncharacterized protein n=1 Tax=Streblomastix strix TaxID=222440 RepID=A0A5J4WVZ8_9EUKA|nr:MAG: hypothetical protein EZS28_005291 [Streblomastix strix]